MSKSCCGRCKTVRVMNSLWRGGMYALERNDVILAETMQRQALEMLGSLGGMPVVEARIRNNLGIILSTSGRRGEAEKEFAAALRLLKGRVEPSSRFHQIIAGNLAQTLSPAPSNERPASRAALQ